VTDSDADSLPGGSTGDRSLPGTPDADPKLATMAACESAAVFDLADQESLEMTGPDRNSFLHGFCTNDIRGLAAGQVCEAFLCNVKGRILGHITVAALPESLWLDTAPGQAAHLKAHLEKYHLLENFQLTDRSAEWASLLVAGPQASARLADCGVAWTDPQGLTAIEQTLAVVGDPVTVRIARVDPIGVPGFLLSVPVASRGALRERLIQAGAVPASRDVFEAMRIEAGVPRYGVDLSDENLAQEAGRTAQAISFTKGCYLGQEPVARIHALGHVNRMLRCLAVEGAVIPGPGTVLVDPKQPEKEVGRVTSAAWSWRLDCPVALAIVRTAVSKTGSEVLIAGEPATTARVMSS